MGGMTRRQMPDDQYVFGNDNRDNSGEGLDDEVKRMGSGVPMCFEGGTRAQGFPSESETRPAGYTLPKEGKDYEHRPSRRDLGREIPYASPVHGESGVEGITGTAGFVKAEKGSQQHGMAGEKCGVNGCGYASDSHAMAMHRTTRHGMKG